MPALVFGIPGDSITAILIGVLMMKGLRPGPMIFEQQPVLLYAVYVTFLLANILLVPLVYTWPSALAACSCGCRKTTCCR